MTKAELARELANEVDGLTRVGALNIVNVFFQTIASCLAKGEKLQIVGFGAFEIQRRAARKGRNPRKPAEEMDIPARNVLVFHAGKALKDAVNAAGE